MANEKVCEKIRLSLDSDVVLCRSLKKLFRNMKRIEASSRSTCTTYFMITMLYLKCQTWVVVDSSYVVLYCEKIIWEIKMYVRK